MSSVRVRFAPSPTGHLHIGSLRTALFNWLFARHTGGSFLVRIEDTDKERSEGHFVDSIEKSLSWVGIISDEPHVKQSDNFDIHVQYLNGLLKSGKAYYCICPSQSFDYDGQPCRCETSQLPEEEKETAAIRFKIPDSIESISFDDVIRGTITIDRDQLDDFIIARSDGTPVYNFVVVVDDASMNISHVIRGEDHISNTPKQILLYRALGFEVPVFAHIPLILGESGQRLSKRDAATSVLEYKDGGYLPQAFSNYLVRLGWSHGDQELFTRQELIQLFKLEDVGKSGAVFDPAKLDWLNGLYIRNTSDQDLLKYILATINPDFKKSISLWDDATICGFIGLYKQRAKTVNEIVEGISTVYCYSGEASENEIKKWVSRDAVCLYKLFVVELEKAQMFTPSGLMEVAKEFTKNNEIKMVQLAQPLRLALTGSASGPSVFELLTLLGKKESLNRISVFLAQVTNFHSKQM